MNYLKCKLCCKEILKAPSIYINDPINKIINKYDEIVDICKNKEGKILMIFYFIRNNFQKILYDNDKIINIEDLNIKPEISELFYLSLLLDNSNLINFKYSFDFIKILDTSIKEEISIRKIILSKIIIILIDYAKGLDFYYQYMNELKELKNKNIEIITNNLELFNNKFTLEYDINSFLNNKIDYIYMEIIISFIKKNQYNNDINYKEIFEQLDLKSISITETIFDGLSKELDVDKNEFLEDYIINEDNIENKKVINFYEILFKYILKSPLYLYKNNFLKENEDNFVQLKNNYEKYKSLNISSLYEYIKSNNQEKSDIFNDAKINHEDTSDRQITINENNSTINKAFEAYVKDRIKKIDINTVREMLKKLKIILDIDYKAFKEITITKTLFMFGKDYKKIINYTDDLYNLDYDDKQGNSEEKKIYKKFMQFLKFLGDIKEYILKSKIHFNPRIILELKRIELESGDFDMKCIYSFENQTLEEEIKFMDYNILSNGINGKNLGLILLINELCDEDYEGEEYSYND